MASIVTGLIEQVKIDAGANQSIASTAYGICNTLSDQAAKTVEMTGFKLITGVTVHIKFTYSNAAENPPTLNINNTGAKSIVQYGTTSAGTNAETNGWQAGAVLSLTYDGTSWVRDQGYNTNTNTWRGIQDNLTSDSATDSLSAKQGKALKGLIDAMDASTPAASGNATAFIDSITQTDGKITSITKKNIPTVSKDTAGLAPKGAAVSTQSQSTKFLREDGSWAAPTYTSNTDQKVKQNANTENKEYSILLKTTDNVTGETGEVKFGATTNKLVTINPSTGRITAPGGLAGVADSANAVAWGNVSSKPTSIKLTGAVTGSVTLGSGENSIATTVNHTHTYLSSIAWDNSNKKITQSVNGAAATAILEFVAGSNITLTPAAGKLTIANSYSYTLPIALYNKLGGLKPAYTSTAAATLTTAAATNTDTPTIAAKTTTSGRYYAVEADKNGIAYVNVPWTDHYAWGDITSKPATATRWPTWNEVTSKPSTFSPSSHTHSYITSRGNVTNETGGNKPAQAGLSMSNAYNNGYPITYGNVLTMYGSGASQLLIGWSSSNGVREESYIRSQRDTAGSLWSAWEKILTSGNTSAPSTVPTLVWNTEATIFTLGGTAVKVKAMTKPTYAFTDLTSHPTSLSGYGITDAKIASGVITLGSNTITPVTSVNGHTGSSVSVTAGDLGLASALKYVGAKSSLPTATDSTTYSTYNNGDVITVSNKEYAYVKGSNAAGSSWVELGDEGSYKLKQTAITNSTGSADGTNTATTFIYSFSQDAQGVVSVKTRKLPTYNNYSHPTGDGNLHVPANGTGNNGKFLQATATAGSYQWASVTKSTVGLNNVTNDKQLPLAGGTMTGDITFAATTFSSNPTDSKGLVWSGGTDSAKIFYRQTANNAGSLVLQVSDDGEEYINFRHTAGGMVYLKPNTREFYPNEDNKGSIGTSSYKWANMYATTFNGALIGNVTGDVSGSSGSCTGNAATATKATQDGSGNTITNKYFQIYNTNYQGNSSAVTVNDLANQGPAYGMINSATDNPTGSATWVHVLNMGWNKANTSWIGQIALHTNGAVMYFRGNSSSAISGKGWNTVLSSNNYTSYTVKKDGTGATGSWGISITGTASNVTGTVAIEHGGTNATTAAGARTNLGLGSIATYNAATAGTKDTWGLVPVIGASDGVMEVGKYIDFHTTDGNTKDYDVRITAATTGLTISGTTSGTFSGSLTGNAGSASTVSAKLVTNKKIYFLGTETTITSTAANVSLEGDTGVYITTTAGEFSAVRHSYNVSGTEKAYTTYNSTDNSIDFIFL